MLLRMDDNKPSARCDSHPKRVSDALVLHGLLVAENGSCINGLRPQGRPQRPRLVREPTKQKPPTRKVWDVRSLDLAFDDLPRENPPAPNSWSGV